MINKFFNEGIHNKIVETFTKNGIINMSLMDINYEDLSQNNNSMVNERWTYIFNYSNSQCIVKVSIINPVSSIQVYFCRDKSYFGFQDYLKSIKNKEVEKNYLRTFKEKGTYTEEKYIYDYLEIVERHLTTDLLKVAKGEEWKEVPVDYKDMG